MLPNSRGFVDSFKILTFQHYLYSLPFFQNHSKMSILLSFFLPSTKTNHSISPPEGCGNKYSQDLNWKKKSREKKFQMIWIRPFQEKEMEGGERRSQLGGQWKVLLLGGPWKLPLFNGPWKFTLFGSLWKLTLFGNLWKLTLLGSLWKLPLLSGPWKVPLFGGPWKVPLLSGPWKVSLFGGPWKVPLLCGPWKVLLFGGPWKVPLLGGPWKVLLLGGQWKEKGQHIFTSSHFPSNKLYLNLQFFPLTLRFYFTMVLGRYLRIPFLFFDL